MQEAPLHLYDPRRGGQALTIEPLRAHTELTESQRSNCFTVVIDAHYRTLHRPSDYAALVHLTPKSLARLVKSHFQKTLTHLIRERIMRQAKWELLHAIKPVKQVAAELGFADVFHFSRLFKREAGCSPTFFREYETAIRGGRNLSISWRDPSIPTPAPVSHNKRDPAEAT